MSPSRSILERHDVVVAHPPVDVRSSVVPLQVFNPTEMYVMLYQDSQSAVMELSVECIGQLKETSSCENKLSTVGTVYSEVLMKREEVHGQTNIPGHLKELAASMYTS